MEPLSIGLGGGLVLLGWLLGRWGRRSAAKKSQQAISYMCSCGHPLALHDRDSGNCHEETSRPYYRDDGERNGREWVRCKCHHYDGPEHVDVLGWQPPTIHGIEKGTGGGA